MLTRAPSLRFWLLVTMMTTAAIGLGAAVLLFNHVQNSSERAADLRKARQQARSVAVEVQRGASPARLAALQDLLATDQITVQRNGRTIYRGPQPVGREFELRATATFPGGAVTIADYTNPGPSVTLDLTLITAGVLALVIGAAIAAATLVTRAVRLPVQRAIDAAEAVSRGDFTARMGTSGPEELVKLGSAFDDMATRLERADQDQRRFLADVAHEIATPVNAVSGFALALADGTVHTQADRDEAKLAISAQTGRLRDLLGGLRELTQLDLAEGVRPTRLALTPFAERLVASFQAAARDANVELRMQADAGDIVTDPRLLEMIASNLLSNAIRYTPAGGSVQFDVHRLGGELRISVRDTGVGISREDQKRIFERLYRVDSTRDRATGGSGLGLAIVRRATQALGGQITVASRPGEGSEFVVTLPAEPSGAIVPSGAPAQTSSSAERSSA